MPEAAAVAKPLRLRDLRHDAATRFWRAYKDVLSQQFLGDSDIKSVMRCVNIGGKDASRLTGRAFDCRRSVAEVLHKIQANHRC